MNAIRTLTTLYACGHSVHLEDLPYGKFVRVEGESRLSFALQMEIHRNREGLVVLLEEGISSSLAEEFFGERKEGAA